MRVAEFFKMFSRGLSIAAVCLLLAACANSAMKSSTSAVADVPHDFDLVLQADKDGQFDLDGATLAPEDLRSHLRYRIEQQRPVHNALLKRSEKNKIQKAHIISLASIAHDLGFSAYLDNDGIKAIKMEK